MTHESQETNPYVGPRPFERQDRDLFFGRDGEASEILYLVFTHRNFLIYAQSGAGKTSLINAALIPMLEEEGFEVLPLARVRGLIPQHIEPQEITNLYVFNTLMSWEEDEADLRRLAQMSLADFLKEREHPTGEEGLPVPRAAIFDQFEELFVFHQERWQDREGFFEQVRDAMEEDSLLRVVFVMREDLIAELDPYKPLLPERLRTRFRLERLRQEAALAAVTGPLRATGRPFAPGVAEQLVEELLKVRVEIAAGYTVTVTGEFVEPLQLQIVCQNLWWGLPLDVTVITQDHLQAFGDVNQALSRFYERSIERAAQEAGVKEEDLRAWFAHTLITPAGTRGTICRGREETGGIPNAAVDVFQNLHLIRGEWRAGARWYELTHDRFIEPIQESKPKAIAFPIPIISEIAAGKARPTSNDVTGYFATDTLRIGDQQFTVQMPKGSQLKFLPEYRYFAVHVVGDSMADAGIAPGDYVILAKPLLPELSPQHGDIVVAVITDVDEKATLKRFLLRYNRIILKPESPNPAHQAHEFSLQEFNNRVRIAGVSVAVLKPI
jgi:SOS-response transcriptional repressor LexA